MNKKLVIKKKEKLANPKVVGVYKQDERIDGLVAKTVGLEVVYEDLKQSVANIESASTQNINRFYARLEELRVGLETLTGEENLTRSNLRLAASHDQLTKLEQHYKDNLEKANGKFLALDILLCGTLFICSLAMGVALNSAVIPIMGMVVSAVYFISQNV